MRHHILIILAFSIVTNAFSQYSPLVEPNKHWFYQTYSNADYGGIKCGFILNFDGDTVVNNMVYSKLMRNSLIGTNNCPNPPCFVPNIPFEIENKSLLALIREDANEQKVYYLNPSQNSTSCDSIETLLFDFALNVNDSINTCKTGMVKIDSITNEDFFGSQRQILNTTGLVPIIGLQYSDKIRLIEGIGYENQGFFPGSLDELIDVCFGTLRNCNILSSTKSINRFDISIFPNPTKDILEVRANESIAEVSIHSIDGQQLQIHKETQIDISYFNPGIYLIKVQLENGEFWVEKLVKTR